MAGSDLMQGGLRSTFGVRITAVCGMLWGVLAIVRLMLTGEIDRPDWTSSTASIVDFYEKAQFDSKLLAGVGLVALGYILVLVFFSKVASIVETYGNGAPWLGKSIVATAIVTVTFALGYLGTFLAAVFWSSHGGLGADGYLVLHGLSFAAYGLSLLSDLVLGVLLGGAFLVTRLFPSWLGWAVILTGLAEGVAWFLSPAVWDATSGLPYLWVFIAAAIMFRRAEKYTAA